MRKIVSLLLVAVMVLAMAACGSSAPAANETPAAAPEAPAADVAMQYKTPAEAKELLNNDAYVFFDLRKAADSSAATVPGAQAWDMDKAKEGDVEYGKKTMKEATKGLDKEIVLVCYSGKRYAQAATNALSAIGYDMSKVWTLEGGFTAWSETYPELVKNPPELNKIRLNWGGSGNILWAVALENGYLADEGIEVEFVQATNNTDMLTLLQSGQVDICTNAGTADPLAFIASGADFTIWGGHMVQGCMPIIALPGTEWNGVESFVGEKIGVKPNYFAVTGALMEKGYDDPLSAAEFQSLNYNDALAALLRGELKYALVGTSQNYPVQQLVEEGKVEIVAYHGDIMPNYSCCRMESTTDFVNNNPNTIKAILRALLRAECYYQNNKEACPPILAKIQGVDNAVVEAFMLNPYYKPTLDPLRNGIVRAWDILDKTGFLDENAKNIDINDHINTDLYEQALAEYEALYGAEDPDFIKGMKDFYNEWNK
ncbi:MAG: ABC transporter substrate-binding protein [Oscillospiraceae bacterium]|nr:ABC transporter substrate-binding protein [Oscillospiraceae bacterium]